MKLAAKHQTQDSGSCRPLERRQPESWWEPYMSTGELSYQPNCSRPRLPHADTRAVWRRGERGGGNAENGCSTITCLDRNPTKKGRCHCQLPSIAFCPLVVNWGCCQSGVQNGEGTQVVWELNWGAKASQSALAFS